MPGPNHPGLELSAEVLDRLRELPRGRSCCRCDHPAARLVGDRFFCPTHVPVKRPPAPRPARVYRVSRG